MLKDGSPTDPASAVDGRTQREANENKISGNYSTSLPDEIDLVSILHHCGDRAQFWVLPIRENVTVHESGENAESRD